MNKSIITYIIVGVVGVAVALLLNANNFLPSTFGDNGWAIVSGITGMIVFAIVSFLLRKK